mgnify:CR=1 FL=1
MPRPERHDADYFPFYVKDGKTLFVLQHKYGLEGIGFFTNLMRILTSTPDHYLCIADPGDSLYVFSRIGIDEERGLEMIEDLVKTGKLHKELWNEKRIILSPDLLESLEPLYEKRINDIVTVEEIVSGAGNPAACEFPGPETPETDDFLEFPVSETHKVKKSKEEKSKEKTRVSSPLNSRYEKSREMWNESGLPRYPYIAENCPPVEMREIIPTFDTHPPEIIVEAIKNYAKIFASPEYDLNPEYQSFTGFMKPGKGVDKYQDAAKPFERCKINGSRASPEKRLKPDEVKPVDW